MDRRTFLRNSAAATLAATSLPIEAAADAANRATSRDSRVQRYRRLGRTNIEMSDISFGSSSLKDADTVRYALDRGVNYFDTAEMYGEGRVERLIGEALQGKRDSVYIASKVMAAFDDRKEDMMRALESSLGRLRTDYVDIYFNHAVNDVRRMENPEWHEFVALAKAQGKIRFSGMSGHGGRLQECLEMAIGGDWVDVILVAHNFGSDPAFYERYTRGFDFVANQTGLPRLLKLARQRNIGTIAMKTLMGARLNDMRAYEWGGATFAQAAFRWVFSGNHVDALVVSMTDKSLVDEYLGASGQSKVRAADRRLLDAYVSANSGAYCRNGCSQCSSSCPAGVQIADVLRARMYQVDYHNPEVASQSYAALARDASSCVTCTQPVCLSSCPFDLPIPNLTREAEELLG
ncbi:MAG: aldo/keto reductase [Myxococcales bacterium]|nr:aldo/keto reductase [Myxococcales bacterium]